MLLAYNQHMSAHWLMGERQDGVLRVYVRCGRCGAKLLLADDVDPRELLRSHEAKGHRAQTARAAS